MAGSYNKIIVLGHLGRDPEMRYLPSGEPVADFSVATSERRGTGSQAQDTTTWFRVSAFGKLAETVSQYLHKGSYIYVEGPLSAREWTDREGATRTSLEVRAREIRLLDKRGEGEEAAAPPAAPVAARAGRAAEPDPDIDVDQIPF